MTTLAYRIQELHDSLWLAYVGNVGSRTTTVGREVNYQIGTMGYGDMRRITLFHRANGKTDTLLLTMKTNGVVAYVLESEAREEFAASRKSVQLTSGVHFMKATVKTLKSGVIRIRLGGHYITDGTKYKTDSTVKDYAACDAIEAYAQWLATLENMDGMRKVIR